MNNRYKLPKGIQRKYLLKAEKVSKLSGDQLASLFGVVGRSYRDWRREKFTITQKAVEIIERRYHLKFPYSKKQALSLWKKSKIEISRRGGIAALKKHGSPGTFEGRKLGGRHGLAVLRLKGLIPQPKPFNGPKQYSLRLAEFVGIILGDGHIGKEQWSITLNSIADKQYAIFVAKLVKNLFKFKPSIYKRKDSHVVIICGSGTHSIQYFQSLGLKIGNKVKQQVDVPKWIKSSLAYAKTSLRGLMDTDGGVFLHKYKVNGKIYCYKKICFSNRSLPLLYFVGKTLKDLGFTPKLITKVENKKVWLYNKDEVEKYLSIVGTHNSRLLKYQN